MRQAADEAALLEAADEPVDARFRLEAQRVLHFLERGRNAAIRQATVDEEQQLILFARQHGDSRAFEVVNPRKGANKTKTSVDVLVWFRWGSQACLARAPARTRILRLKAPPGTRCRPSRPLGRRERGACG